MCLFLTDSPHGNVRKSLNIPREVLKLSPDTKVAFWKVYRRTPSGRIRSLYRNPKLSIVKNDGWQISDRSGVNFNILTKQEFDDRIVERGIHVCVSKLKARRLLRRMNGCPHRCSLFKVYARRGDILAYDRDGREAACSKIYVPSADKTKKVRHGRVR